MVRENVLASSLAVTVLVLPESSMMCLASVIDPLRAANRVAGRQLFQWEMTSVDGNSIELTCGMPCEISKRFSDQMRGDLLVVIGGFNQQRHVNSSNLAALRKAAGSFEYVAGVEAGTWVVARTGLLDGYQATTHWEDFEAFASQFPEVELKLDRFVTDRNRMTCGGASPALDMILEFIRMKHGTTLSAEVASVFVYEQTRSRNDLQPVFSLGRLTSRERRLEQAVRLMESAIENPLPIAVVAKQVNASPKTLEVIFKKHLGMTPGKFFLNLRLKSADRLVVNSDLEMSEIAVRTGFASLSAFSRAYRKEFGVAARFRRAQSL